MKCSFFSNHSQKTNQRHIANAQCFGTMSCLISDFQWSMLVHFLRLLVRHPSLKSQPTHRLRRAAASQGDAWKIFSDKLITWSKWPQFQAVLVWKKMGRCQGFPHVNGKVLEDDRMFGKKRFKPGTTSFRSLGVKTPFPSVKIWNHHQIGTTFYQERLFGGSVVKTLFF